MLAARLLLSKIAPREERDARSAAAVLDAASDRLGKPRLPAIARNLENHDVMWAWQLAELSDEDWRSFNVPVGLKTAVRAELTSPTSVEFLTGRAVAASAVSSGVSNERLRNFLLMPDGQNANGAPLHSLNALFLALLTTPVEDRQQLLIALCELLALISGLALPITLEFRRDVSEVAHTDDKGWDVAPTLLDALDGITVFIFDVNVTLVMLSIFFALIIVAGGHCPDDDLCEGILGCLGVLTAAIFLCVLVPIFYLFLVHTIMVSASPYAAIGGFVLMNIVIMVINTNMFNFALEHFALEFYHWPHSAKNQFKNLVPWIRHKFSDKALKPLAERRAAKLREKLLRTSSAKYDT